MFIYLYLHVSTYLSYWFSCVKEETIMEIIKCFELNEKNICGIWLKQYS